MANYSFPIAKDRFVEVLSINDVLDNRKRLWRVSPHSLLTLFSEGGDRYFSTAFDRDHKKRLSVERPMLRPSPP